jgi:hypothetical protein
MAEAQLRTYNPTLREPVATWPLGGRRRFVERRSPAEGPRHYAFDGSGVAGYDPETGMVVDPWIDVAKTVPAVLRATAETSVGTGGDIAGLQERAIRWILAATGGSPEREDQVLRAAKFGAWSSLPSTAGIRRKVTDPLLGEAHKASTTPGKLVEDYGGFAFGAALPGGALRKTAMVVGPALGSETAGRLTEGTAWEPLARAAGALAGGAAALSVRPRSVRSSGRLRDAATEPLPALEQTALIKALQRIGRAPDEILRALVQLRAARTQTTPQRPSAADMPADDLPAFDEAAATERVRVAHDMAPSEDDWREPLTAQIRRVLDGSHPEYPWTFRPYG